MRRGRPRHFDTDRALEQAMRVFWSHGYDGTTIPHLTEAMGISRPSLYAAFGNKEQIFRKAMDRYACGPAAHVRESLEEPTARKVVEKLWKGSIHLLTDRHNPAGCLSVQGALVGGPDTQSICGEATTRRIAAETALRKRFEQAKKDGDLPPHAKPADLAGFAATIAHGMAVQAAGGATRTELQKIVEMALQAWPGR